jgi:hypothetical protein
MSKKTKPTSPSRGSRAPRRRQRILARRHEPASRPSPFAFGGRRATPRSAEADLVSDLVVLIAAGLVEPKHDEQGTRYSVVDPFAGDGGAVFDAEHANEPHDAGDSDGDLGVETVGVDNVHFDAYANIGSDHDENVDDQPDVNDDVDGHDVGDGHDVDDDEDGFAEDEPGVTCPPILVPIPPRGRTSAKGGER